jgi:hypothetical protein
MAWVSGHGRHAQDVLLPMTDSGPQNFVGGQNAERQTLVFQILGGDNATAMIALAHSLVEDTLARVIYFKLEIDSPTMLDSLRRASINVQLDLLKEIRPDRHSKAAVDALRAFNALRNATLKTPNAHIPQSQLDACLYKAARWFYQWQAPWDHQEREALIERLAEDARGEGWPNAGKRICEWILTAIITQILAGISHNSLPSEAQPVRINAENFPIMAVVNRDEETIDLPDAQWRTAIPTTQAD